MPVSEDVNELKRRNHRPARIDRPASQKLQTNQELKHQGRGTFGLRVLNVYERRIHIYLVRAYAIIFYLPDIYPTPRKFKKKKKKNYKIARRLGRDLEQDVLSYEKKTYLNDLASSRRQ